MRSSSILRIESSIRMKSVGRIAGPRDIVLKAHHAARLELPTLW